MKIVAIVLMATMLIACDDNLFNKDSDNDSNNNAGTVAVNLGDILDENSDLDVPPEVLELVECETDGNPGLYVCNFLDDNSFQTHCLTVEQLEIELGQVTCEDPKHHSSASAAVMIGTIAVATMTTMMMTTMMIAASLL